MEHVFMHLNVRVLARPNELSDETTESTCVACGGVGIDTIASTPFGSQIYCNCLSLLLLYLNLLLQHFEHMVLNHLMMEGFNDLVES